jgi:hypothetical protein
MQPMAQAMGKRPEAKKLQRGERRALAGSFLLTPYDGPREPQVDRLCPRTTWK